MSIDFNILYAVIIAIGVVLYVRFVKPYLKKNKIDVFEEVKLFLIVSGFAIRDDKARAMFAMILDIVKNLEALDLSPDEKHFIAVDNAIRQLLIDFEIDIPEQVIEGLIRIAVTQLEPTHK